MLIVLPKDVDRIVYRDGWVLVLACGAEIPFECGGVGDEVCVDAEMCDRGCADCPVSEVGDYRRAGT
jgi:hypothetical protein